MCQYQSARSGSVRPGCGWNGFLGGGGGGGGCYVCCTIVADRSLLLVPLLGDPGWTRATVKKGLYCVTRRRVTGRRFLVLAAVVLQAFGFFELQKLLWLRLGLDNSTMSRTEMNENRKGDLFWLESITDFQRV